MPADTPRPTRARLRRAFRALGIASGLLAVVVVLAGSSLPTAAAAQQGEQSSQDVDEDVVLRGRQVYGARCAICHGESGRGVESDGPAAGPSLIGVGPASVDFMLRTGRMPLDNANERLRHREQQVTETEREALIAYITSLAPDEGPDIPDVEGFEHAELSHGLELYTTNCAACHGPTAAGIAVGQRDVSSTLDVATPLEIAEAIRTGPGVMPVFSQEVMSEEDLHAVVNWVVHLRQRDAPGGLQIGRSGPVSEGLVAWVVGFGLLTLVMYLIGEKSHGDDDVAA